MRLPEGQLFGLQLITNFVGVDTPVRIPTELVLPHLNAEQELALFCEKLSLLENCQDFFMTHQLRAWVNINEHIVDAILSEQQLITRISRLPFIELTINESFTDLNLGSGNLRLREISKLFALVLENFGAGMATTKSIFDGLFTSIMLDKGFIHKQIHASSFTPFMQAITDQISPFCRALIIAGIDDEASLVKARLLGFSAMQGSLWPAVPVESIADLLLPDSSL
ncbi:EAL domain-containing protein [Dryocola boscaweniae]|nr:EAL domain-containing protein [Dryocola boscaweniae]